MPAKCQAIQLLTCKLFVLASRASIEDIYEPCFSLPALPCCLRIMQADAVVTAKALLLD